MRKIEGENERKKEREREWERDKSIFIKKDNCKGGTVRN